MDYIVYNTNFEKSYGRFMRLEDAQKRWLELVNSPPSYMEAHWEWLAIFEAKRLTITR